MTRTATGVYSVRFAGLGRTPGQRDNVQVSAYNTAPVYCKPAIWDASGADLVIPVSCFSPNGTPMDSPFTVLALGAWAFGKTAPLAFALSVTDAGPPYSIARRRPATRPEATLLSGMSPKDTSRWTSRAWSRRGRRRR